MSDKSEGMTLAEIIDRQAEEIAVLKADLATAKDTRRLLDDLKELMLKEPWR